MGYAAILPAKNVRIHAFRIYWYVWSGGVVNVLNRRDYVGMDIAVYSKLKSPPPVKVAG